MCHVVRVLFFDWLVISFYRGAHALTSDWLVCVPGYRDLIVI